MTSTNWSYDPIHPIYCVLTLSKTNQTYICMTRHRSEPVADLILKKGADKIIRRMRQTVYTNSISKYKQ